MGRHNWHDQNGAVAVIVGVLLVVLLGFVGLALDVANLMLNKTQMKTAANAAVLAGAGGLATSQSQAGSQANTYLTKNNVDPATATITYTADTARNLSNAPEINCTVTRTVPMNFMSMLGFSSQTLTVTAEAILPTSPGSGNGQAFNYAIFSNQPLTLSGAVNVGGSVHSNHRTTISGSAHVNGAVEGATGVTISGAYNISGQVMADTVGDVTLSGAGHYGGKAGGAENIAMPDFSAQVQSVAVKTFTGNQTFSGATNYGGSIYVDGNVTISGAMNFTGAILATGNITVSGAANISGSNQVCLYSSGGNVTLSGATSFGTGSSSVIVYAPNGTITVSGASSLNGRLVGNQVTYSGAANVQGLNFPVTSLPVTSTQYGQPSLIS